MNTTALAKPFLWGFLLLVLIADLFMISIGENAPRYYTKTLLLPLLLLIYLVSAGGKQKPRDLYFVLGLLFSFLGDLFLLEASQFLLGLGSFLVAHIFYCLAFARLSRRALSKPLLIGLALYGVVFVSFLFPYLADKKIPVLLYIGVIFTMLLYASRTRNRALYLGALFFVLSDSVLAYGLFYASSTVSSILVMVSYILAQSLLVLGMVAETQVESAPLEHN